MYVRGGPNPGPCGAHAEPGRRGTGVRAMWALYHRPDGITLEEGRALHAYVIIGTASATKVLPPSQNS